MKKFFVANSIQIILITMNIMLSIQCILLSHKVQNKIVYDMDTIREQYMGDIRYAMQGACITGTDYPPEWRESTAEYNTRTPVAYCFNYWQNKYDEVYGNMTRLGMKVGK